MTLIKPTRRDILKVAAAMPAFALPAYAQLGAPQQASNNGVFRFSLGDVRLTILSDGHFSTPTTGLGVNAEHAEVRAFLEGHYLDPDKGYSHTNHLLIETAEHKVLVDVGSGNRWFDTTGRLVSNLEAAGVALTDITHVVITHAHPDHIWGIRDDFDEPLFPDAEYIIGEAEHAYWSQDGLADRVAPAMQQFVAGAVNSFATEGLEWTLAGEGHEVVSGVTLISTPGHTPGHMSVQLSAGDKTLIALGDSMSHAWTNFSHPGWYNGFDSDGDLTVQTRKKLLDRAAADRISLLGYHFPFPGVGHVMREGDAYRFVPALWQF